MQCKSIIYSAATLSFRSTKEPEHLLNVKDHKSCKDVQANFKLFLHVGSVKVKLTALMDKKNPRFSNQPQHFNAAQISENFIRNNCMYSELRESAAFITC
jgi:hypothetical protein